jgi:hypothetical protein
MTVLFLMTVISAAAVTFFVCFFSAACNDKPARTCRVARISSSPIQRTGEVTPFRATSTMLLHRASAVLR